MLSLKNENRWLNGAIPALLIHSCIGSVYCWSLIKGSISTAMSVSVSSIEAAFMLAIFCLGMSAAFGGSFVEKNVRWSSLISAVCFSSGLIGSVLSIHLGSSWLLFLTYGVLMGVGLGIGYISPVKTLMLWFKDNPGLATGIAISGFGLSKVLFSPFIEWCIPKAGIEVTLLSMSFISILSMLLATFLIKKPSGWIESTNRFSLTELFSIIKKKDYILTWLMFFTNITCGLVIISFEKNIITSTVLLSGYIALISSLSAGFNTLGRFGYATSSDYIQKKYLIYSIIFISSFIVCFMVYSLGLTWWTSLLMILIVNMGYGGGFSTLPILLKSRFGMEKISTIHGLTLSAWAWASVASFGITQIFIYKLGFDFNKVSLILSGMYLLMFLFSLSFLRKK